MGSKPSTPEELQKTIEELFDAILILRCGGRIIGAFMESDLEERTRRLEQGLEKVNNLAEQIVEWITGLPPKEES